jgi:hypothetical protein
LLLLPSLLLLSPSLILLWLPSTSPSPLLPLLL